MIVRRSRTESGSLLFQAEEDQKDEFTMDPDKDWDDDEKEEEDEDWDDE